MTKKEIHITSEGFLELEEELIRLKTEERPLVIEAIKEARAQGDLAENAEYDAARTEQAELENKIAELEYKLNNAIIIKKKKSNGYVDLGSTVEIEYLQDKEIEKYQIVGSLEADPFENKISNESPIGSTIINKKVGDILQVESPTGSYEIKIIKIS